MYDIGYRARARCDVTSMKSSQRTSHGVMGGNVVATGLRSGNEITWIEGSIVAPEYARRPERELKATALTPEVFSVHINAGVFVAATLVGAHAQQSSFGPRNLGVIR